MLITCSHRLRSITCISSLRTSCSLRIQMACCWKFNSGKSSCRKCFLLLFVGVKWRNFARKLVLHLNQMEWKVGRIHRSKHYEHIVYSMWRITWISWPKAAAPNWNFKRQFPCIISKCAIYGGILIASKRFSLDCRWKRIMWNGQRIIRKFIIQSNDSLLVMVNSMKPFSIKKGLLLIFFVW